MWFSVVQPFLRMLKGQDGGGRAHRFLLSTMQLGVHLLLTSVVVTNILRAATLREVG